MRQKILLKIKNALKKARRAAVFAHVDPDGDAIGSALALAMVLEKSGIAATIYSEDGVPRIYSFLPWSERVVRHLPTASHFDLVLTVDSSDIRRVGSKVNLRDLAPVIINIDHHPDNTAFGDINLVENISSASELVFGLAKYLKVKLDKKMADCLYVALITDTGNFRYESTTVQTFNMAAELIKAGVAPHEVTTRIYDSKTISSIKIKSAALSGLEFTPDKKIAWAAVTEEMMHRADAHGEDLIGLVDQIRAIDGIEVAILLREENGQIKINFRSKYKVNVGEIARQFGGGGHVKAAGAVIKGPLDRVEEKVVAAAVKYLKATNYLV